MSLFSVSAQEVHWRSATFFVVSLAFSLSFSLEREYSHILPHYQAVILGTLYSKRHTESRVLRVMTTTSANKYSTMVLFYSLSSGGRDGCDRAECHANSVKFMIYQYNTLRT